MVVNVMISTNIGQRHQLRAGGAPSRRSSGFHYALPVWARRGSICISYEAGLGARNASSEPFRAPATVARRPLVYCTPDSTTRPTNPARHPSPNRIALHAPGRHEHGEGATVPLPRPAGASHGAQLFLREHLRSASLLYIIHPPSRRSFEGRGKRREGGACHPSTSHASITGGDN